jgi:hypothetical protein
MMHLYIQLLSGCSCYQKLRKPCPLTKVGVANLRSRRAVRNGQTAVVNEFLTPEMQFWQLIPFGSPPLFVIDPSAPSSQRITVDDA